MELRMNYINFKNFVNHKLDLLKEDLIKSINIPENTITYNGILGSYVINPFGYNSYSFDVIFNDEESLNKFIKSITKSDIYEYIEDNTHVSSSGIYNHFIVCGFFNKALLNDIQVEFKKILNG